MADDPIRSLKHAINEMVCAFDAFEAALAHVEREAEKLTAYEAKGRSNASTKA